MPATPLVVLHWVTNRQHYEPALPIEPPIALPSPPRSPASRVKSTDDEMDPDNYEQPEGSDRPLAARAARRTTKAPATRSTTHTPHSVRSTRTHSLTQLARSTLSHVHAALHRLPRLTTPQPKASPQLPAPSLPVLPAPRRRHLSRPKHPQAQSHPSLTLARNHATRAIATTAPTQMPPRLQHAPSHARHPRTPRAQPHHIRNTLAQPQHLHGSAPGPRSPP